MSLFYLEYVSLVPMQSSKYQSVGDIIRDLDFKSKIEDHFFLVHSDVVSNVNLKAALQKHKQLYKQSKLNSLTAVLNNNLSPDNPIVSASNQFKAMFLPDTERLVWFSNENSASKMYLDVDLLTQHDRLDAMTNLYGELMFLGIKLISIRPIDFNFSQRLGDKVKRIISIYLLLFSYIYFTLFATRAK